MPDIPAQTLAAGQSIHGFHVHCVTEIPDLFLRAYELRHPASGARVLHLHAEDRENLFSISFPTPPPDDSGLPHILEHAVLGGSQNYPVKDPFFEMYKMSMATFINAMTGWDCTYYPVASNVKQDLFNLADVYFDAVFHPLLSREIFEREGYHLAPRDPEHPEAGLEFSGIVFNEMKGAFSNPESRLYREAARALFPDTVYGRESGGDPQAIPGLTYEAFVQFHADYYHPSNAFFVLYGDIPTAGFAEFLAPRLQGFTAKQVSLDVTRQPRWTAPRERCESYPVEPDERMEGKTFLLMDCLVGDGTDPREDVLAAVLDNILLGHEAAPLRKALIDSHLGEDIISSGFHVVGLESVFSIGIKGSEPERKEAFVALVREALAHIAATPIPPDSVEAAFRQTSYHFLEIPSMYPLNVMDRVLSSWIHGGDPLAFLYMRRHLEACREAYQQDPMLFNRFLRERLLENPHRITVMLKPDRQWQARNDQVFADRLQAIEQTLTPADRREMVQHAAQLAAASATPNPPEALATLPQLTLADLPRSVAAIPTTVLTRSDGITLLRNDVFSNHVNYLEFACDLRGLPERLWAWLPGYADALRKMGAAGQTYEQIAARESAATGGIDCRTCIEHAAGPTPQPVWYFSIRLKALDRQWPEALDLLRDLLFELDPHNDARLRDLICQARASYRTGLVHSGSATAIRHAGRGFHEAGWLAEQLGGLPQLAAMENLYRIPALRPDMMRHLEEIREFMGNRQRWTVSFTGGDDAARRLEEVLSAWGEQRPAGNVAYQPLAGFEPYVVPPREGLAGPIQVAHCAQLLPAPFLNDPAAPALMLACHLIKMDYLMQEIRFRGNAYGATCTYHGLNGMISLGSYRDPHIARTLDVFRKVGSYVEQAPWTQVEVNRAIINTAKHENPPIRPSFATGAALHRHRIGLTHDMRQQQYDRLLATTVADVREQFRRVLAESWSRSAICVVAGREKLEAANREMPGAPLNLHNILAD